MKPTETALITGASSGIGLELARLFAADGSRLILTARSEDRLAAIASELQSAHSVEVHVLPEDLSDPAAPRRLFDAIEAAGLSVDVLVNNAGFGALGLFAKMSLDRQLAMLRLNCEALTHLTWLCLQPMKDRNRGRVLNVGSTAAFFAGPNMAVYYATKAYVLSFSEALREELRKTGIGVTCLCPGPTDTPFAEDSGMGDTSLFRAAMSADRVAKIGYQAMRRGRAIVIPGWRNKLLTQTPRFFPRYWLRWVVQRLQPPPDSGSVQGSDE